MTSPANVDIMSAGRCVGAVGDSLDREIREKGKHITGL